MTTVQTERVLVIPTERFHEIGHFQGFTTDVDRYVSQLLIPENISFRPRSEMEEDPSFKQLIPYVIFQWTDESSNRHLFQYTRGAGQGEERLRRKRSIGIGGHISTDDTEVQDSDPYTAGMQRELSEEVFVETAYKPSCIGMINDDETEVGKVHLGIVHLFEVESPTIRARENEIASASFEPLENLLSAREQFESWSQIGLDAMQNWNP